MSKSRCSAEFLEGQLTASQTCIGCAGFVPDGLSRRSRGKASRQMWAPVPVFESPTATGGNRPSVPPVIVDERGRMTGGNWQAREAVARINRPAEVSAHDLTEDSAFGFLDDEWS